MAEITEKEFLEHYNKDKYEKPSVAVDVAVFTYDEDKLKVLLIRRDAHPYQNLPALPGTFVGISEALESAVKRAVKAKAGVEDIYIEQLYTWGDVDRDPRMRIISVSYMSLVPFEKLQTLGKSKYSPKLYDVDELLSSNKKLAFDHKKIIAYGRERIKQKAENTEIAFELLPERFTLPKLQKVCEVLLERPLQKPNFRKKVAPLVEQTEFMLSGGRTRPSRLYTRKSELEG